MRNRIGIAATLLATLLSLPATVGAQEIERGTRDVRPPLRGRQYGGVGYFVLTGLLLSQGDVNDAFEGAGHPRVDDTYLGFGGGGHFRINRIIVGGEGGTLGTGEATGANSRIDTYGGWGLCQVGYVLLDAWGFTLFPRLGLGGGGVSYRIGSRGAESFDEVLEDPTRGAELSTGGLLAQISFGIDYFLDLDPSEAEKGGFLFGLRLGYTLPVAHGDWELDGKKIDGGPDFPIGGPSLQLVIGGGGFEID